MSPMPLPAFHALLLLGLLVCSIAAAQESSVTLTNPFSSPSDLVQGEKIYLAQCALCHGKDGRGGGGGNDLTSGSFKRASSDEGLFQIVAKGIPGTVMPGFNLSGREIWQVLAYIRSLNVRRSAEIVKGDAAAGAKVFEKHGCGGCHATGAGPDLAGIGARRSLAELRRSILDPQAEVSSAWWRIEATAKDGRKVSGRRLNEDTYTVQLLDAGGRLISLLKSDLAGYTILRESPMPTFRDKLSESELSDLLAFLVKKEQP